MRSPVRFQLIMIAWCICCTWSLRTNAASTGLPVFDRQPANRTVNAGATLTFSPLVSSSEPVSYKWTHNGVSLATRTNLTLTMTNLSRTDAGWYVLLAANDAGRVPSRAAFLTVNDSPSGTIQFNNAAGERVRSISGGNASGTSIQLFAGPTPDRMRPTGASAVVNNGLFVGGTVPIPSVAPGQIVYVKTELADGQQSNVIPVVSGTGFVGGSINDLQHPTLPEWPTPTILEQPNPIDVDLGGTISLSVVIRDYSRVTIKWIKNGNPDPVFEEVLRLGPLTTIEGTSTLEIPQADLSDVGSYKAVILSEYVDTIAVSEPVPVAVVIPGNGEITSIEHIGGFVRIQASGRPNRPYTLEFNSLGGGWNSLFSVASPTGEISYPGFNPPSRHTWFRLSSSD